MDKCNHNFDWESFLDQAKSKNSREFLKAWHSGKSAIKEAHRDKQHLHTIPRRQ